MNSGEYHVASYVVSTRPGEEADVADNIGQLSGLEVHGQGQGKLVVTAEADNVRILADLADELARIESVINVAPVYHEYAGAGEGAS